MKLEEQEKVLNNTQKNMLVSASAGSGKTYIMIEYIKKLVCEKRIPLQKILVLTFTKAAALQMRDRLVSALKNEKADEFILQQLDSISTSNISTIHAFCEKYLKKYANLLGLSENFVILDEGEVEKIHSEAVKRALEKLEKKHPESFAQIMSCYKNNQGKICAIMLQLKELAGAVADRDEFLKKNYNQPRDYFDRAEKFLLKHAKSTIESALEKLERLHLDEFERKMKEVLLPLLCKESLQDFSAAAEDADLPRSPSKTVIGEECAQLLKMLKEEVTQVLDEIKALDLQDEENLSSQKDAKLEKSLIQLFELFEEQEDAIKKAQNALDFSDLEKYMKVLSERENLFSDILYVFVDEYQDTNKIQERIVKNVAKNCNFVAVGDVKQGIYGFRLANSEIFLKDLHDFQQEQDGAVNFLQSNFRSDQRVLDFVNTVFCECMTESSCGVDYAATSMLCGRSEFVPDGQKAVHIDVVCKAEPEVEPLPKVYSVRDAKVQVDSKNLLLLADIRAKIAQVLNSQISDGGKLRPARFGDIAILARDRSSSFSQIFEFLQESGIPVIANSREKLLQKPEIQVLLNYLKIALVLDDDVALLSVLCSPLGGNLQKLVFEVKSGQDARKKTLCQLVLENEKFSDFLKKLEKFRVFYQIFGLKNAFLQLFEETNYISYINLYHPNLKAFVDKFLQELEKFDFDLPSAIKYFDSVEIVVSPESSPVEDAVLLTTIHNSKGLEYPIVFLVDCDANLFSKGRSGEVEVSEEFGLAVKMYDQDTSSELSSVRMLACKISQRAKRRVEELMIFYVALTRAKNRLYLFGEEGKFDFATLSSCKSYFDFVFHALKNEAATFFDAGIFESDNLIIEKISSLEEEDFKAPQNLEQAAANQKIVEKIENYLDFSYDFGESLNYRLKESVTSLNTKNQENVLAKYDSDSISFGGKAVEIGNAYHLALKNIDFAVVEDLKTLSQQLRICEGRGVDVSLIDENILLENVLILKKFTTSSGAKVFKEQEFIMKKRVGEIFGKTLRTVSVEYNGKLESNGELNGKLSRELSSERNRENNRESGAGFGTKSSDPDSQLKKTEASEATLNSKREDLNGASGGSFDISSLSAVGENKILVQGVVDLFVLQKDRAVLIDYKYSNSTNEKYLIEKYAAQLEMYALAIRDAFKVEKIDIYLLSLKNAKLIPYYIDEKDEKDEKGE